MNAGAWAGLAAAVLVPVVMAAVYRAYPVDVAGAAFREEDAAAYARWARRKVGGAIANAVVFVRFTSVVLERAAEAVVPDLRDAEYVFVSELSRLPPSRSHSFSYFSGAFDELKALFRRGAACELGMLAWRT